MPLFNRQGPPQGTGPMTGRQQGYCALNGLPIILAGATKSRVVQVSPNRMEYFFTDPNTGIERYWFIWEYQSNPPGIMLDGEKIVSKSFSGPAEAEKWVNSTFNESLKPLSRKEFVIKNANLIQVNNKTYWNKNVISPERVWKNRNAIKPEGKNKNELIKICGDIKAVLHGDSYERFNQVNHKLKLTNELNTHWDCFLPGGMSGAEIQKAVQVNTEAINMPFQEKNPKDAFWNDFQNNLKAGNLIARLLDNIIPDALKNPFANLQNKIGVIGSYILVGGGIVVIGGTAYYVTKTVKTAKAIKRKIT